MDEIFFFYHNDILEKIAGDVNKIDYSIFSSNFSDKLPDTLSLSISLLWFSLICHEEISKISYLTPSF